MTTRAKKIKAESFAESRFYFERSEKQGSALSAGSYFDDCEICRTMKKAEERGKDLSREELSIAFEKQNQKNSK